MVGGFHLKTPATRELENGQSESLPGVALELGMEIKGHHPQQTAIPSLASVLLPQHLGSYQQESKTAEKSATITKRLAGNMLLPHLLHKMHLDKVRGLENEI